MDSLALQNALQWAGIIAVILLIAAVIGDRIRRSKRFMKERRAWSATLDTREE